MRFRCYVGIILFVITFSHTLDAREPGKKQATTLCSVSVSHSGDDSVGARVALAIKEQLKASSLFRLVDSKARRNLVISLLSVAESHESPHDASAISVVFLGPDGFITHMVIAVGSDQVSWAAEYIVADLDKNTSDQRSLYCTPSAPD